MFICTLKNGFFLYTDLIWASDTWKNPPIMKKEEMSPDTKTPFNQNANFLCTKLFSWKNQRGILKTKSRYMKERTRKENMEMDEEEKEG